MEEIKNNKKVKKPKTPVVIEDVEQDVMEDIEQDMQDEIVIKPVRRKRKRINTDLEVEIMNNFNKVVSIQADERSKNIVLMNYGDTDVMTFGELQKIKSTQGIMLDAMWIVITDIFPNDNEDVELEDVLDKLGLLDIYNEKLMGEDLTDKIQDSNSKVFEKLLCNADISYTKAIVNRCIMLWKQGLFNDYNKREIVKKRVNNEELFEK